MITDITIDSINSMSSLALLRGCALDLYAQNRELKEKVDYLDKRVALLMHAKFGASSEKLRSKNSAATPEGFRNSKNLGDEAKSKLGAKSAAEKKRPKRLKLPKHLPRDQVLVPAPATCQDCGSEDFRKISDDVSETLEHVPGSFRVIQTIRPRCVCLSCNKIVQGEVPSKAIDKGKAGPGLLAHILVQKFCNHLPLYRQSQIYEIEGIVIPRSTMVGWAKACTALLTPLLKELQKYVFSSKEIHGGDTPIKVLDPGSGKTKTGRLWTYVKDGRPHNDEAPPAVCYFFSPDRKGAKPAYHLKDFTGVLHADAYGGYDKIYEGDKIKEAACWAHTRRKFYEVTVSSEHASIARAILEEIGKIYEIEEGIRGLEPEERLKARNEKSKKLVDELFKSFRSDYKKLPRKSPTAMAIAYGLNNEKALKRFLSNGKIEIDNNAAERAMRGIALGRKNYLFAGSDEWGERAAAFYSLIETAKLNDINPWLYLREVLAKIQDHNSQKLAELLPWNIKLPDLMESEASPENQLKNQTEPKIKEL